MTAVAMALAGTAAAMDDTERLLVMVWILQAGGLTGFLILMVMVWLHLRRQNQPPKGRRR